MLDALGDRGDLDFDDVGVIGVSQGGWVIPLVADRIDVDFLIAWSTAINWEEQGQYLTERIMVNANARSDLADRVREADRADRGSTYRDYQVWYASLADDVADYFAEMSEDRWRFAVRNSDLDARETLPAMRGTPVLLLLGGQDDNVDVNDTEQAYREILGSACLDVIRYPDADHNLLDHDGIGHALAGVFAPRHVFADGMLADVSRFADSSHEC